MTKHIKKIIRTKVSVSENFNKLKPIINAYLFLIFWVKNQGFFWKITFQSIRLSVNLTFQGIKIILNVKAYKQNGMGIWVVLSPMKWDYRRRELEKCLAHNKLFNKIIFNLPN